MQQKTGRRVISLLIALILMISGLRITPTTAKAAGKKLNLSTNVLTAYVGRTRKLRVKSVTELLSRKATFKSSDKTVAKVGKAGKVTGISAGTAVITVTSKEDTSITATCTVTVKTPAVSVQTARGITMQKGQKVRIGYSIKPGNVSNKQVTYTTSNKKVAMVGVKGFITARKVGKAKITVKSADGFASKAFWVKVNDTIVPATDVSLDTNKMTLEVGKKQTLKATITPENATKQKVYWVSSNQSVATVGIQGVVRAKSPGTTTITAYASDSSKKKTTCTVTVKAPEPIEVPEPEVPAPEITPALTVTHTLYGSAYTNGKSTLKKALNTAVEYGTDSKAVLKIELSDGSKVDDSKIDSSSAKVSLVDGDGYYASEYQFLADKLNGEWKEGTLEYTLAKGDLELNLEQYPNVDANSGREWSCLGGDGQGNYFFNLKVEGIKYNGKEVESQIIPVHIYIYGYDYTSDAAALYTEEGTPVIAENFAALSTKVENVPVAGTEPVWTWVGTGEKPILCDNYGDDFYITWPEAADASALSTKDVTVTLSSRNGEKKLLTADKDYKVQSGKGETQIALLYQNWEFVPVYDTMTIEVNGTGAQTTKIYDIASVYVYETQQGGGGTRIDGTVTAYSFYGFENLSEWTQIMSTSSYILSCTRDDVVMYYTEDESGAASLTADAAAAQKYDVSGENDRNQKLVGNTVYTTNRIDLKEVEKTVNDETLIFTPVYSGGSLLSPAECDASLKAAPGYVIPTGTANWITNEKWAWQKGIEKGWVGITVSPYSGKFEYSIAKGASQQFLASYKDTPVEGIWTICGDVDEGTTVTQEGIVTVAEVESHTQFAVTFTAADGRKGTVTIKVEEPKTEEPETQEPETQEPETQEPETQEPETQEPETQEPETEEPETQEPGTQEPETEEPETQEPETGGAVES